MSILCVIFYICPVTARYKKYPATTIKTITTEYINLLFFIVFIVNYYYIKINYIKCFTIHHSPHHNATLITIITSQLILPSFLSFLSFILSFVSGRAITDNASKTRPPHHNYYCLLFCLFTQLKRIVYTPINAVLNKAF